MTQNIAVSVSNDVIFITGSVNDQSTEFTAKGNGLWETVVAKKPSGKYDIVVNAYNELGACTTVQTTLYYGLHYVTDRTKQDVINETEKGFYNAVDLNRVEATTKEIAAMLTSWGFPVTIETKTSWNINEFPTETEMRRYLGNVKLCIAQFCTSEGIALPKSMDNLNFDGANSIEKALQEIEVFLEYMSVSLRACGTFDCGEW